MLEETLEDQLEDVLPPAAVLRALPASREALATVRGARQGLRAGRPFAVISGPSSLRDPQQAFDHARRLRRLTDPAGELVVLMHARVDRVEALVTDPSRNGSRDLNLGIAAARQLLLRINEQGLPCAMEPGSFVTPYLEDVILLLEDPIMRSVARDGAQEPATALLRAPIRHAGRGAQPVSAGRR